MKAAILHDKYNLEITDLPVPQPNVDQMLVKVAYCGICGTDVHLFEGDEGSVKLVPGTVPGHELSGTIAGSDQKVVVDPNYYCGQCSACLDGRYHYCENIFNTGVTVNGGFAEYVVVHKTQVHNIPAHVPLTEASFAEPISCCIHGANLTEIAETDRILITGAGTIGLLMLQICRNIGASYIAVSEPVDAKRKLALDLGANAVFNSNSVSNDQLYKCGFNKVIECSGNHRAVETALSVCANCGIVMLFGLTKPDFEMKIKPFELFKRELTIKASYINPGTMTKAIELIADGRIRTTNLVASIIELDQLPMVLADAHKQLENGKILVKLS